MRTNPTITQQKKALKGSIRHWQKDYPKHCDFENQEFDDKWYPNTDLCPLCQLHLRRYRKYLSVNKCGICPLKDGEIEGCNRIDSQWYKATTAVRLGDKSAFMKARRNLIRRMQRALERLETGKPK
jgi:hypothetical protein